MKPWVAKQRQALEPNVGVNIMIDYVSMYALSGKKFTCMVTLLFYFQDDGAIDPTCESHLVFSQHSTTAAITRYGLQQLFDVAAIHKRFKYVLQSGDNGSNLSCYQLAYWATTLHQRYNVEWEIATLCPRDADNECGILALLIIVDYVSDQRGNGIKSRSWAFQTSTGLSFATPKEYADIFVEDAMTHVYVVPETYSNSFTDDLFPGIRELQPPDLSTIINGVKCLGIKDCCHIRTWHRGSLGEKVFKQGIAIAQVTPADGHMFLWDLRKHAKHDVVCKRCTQHQLRPIMNNDHKDSHAPQCRTKTMSDGLRIPKRSLTAVRLQAQHEKATGARLPSVNVADTVDPDDARPEPIEKKQCVSHKLSTEDLVKMLSFIGAVTTGPYDRLMARVNALGLNK